VLDALGAPACLPAGRLAAEAAGVAVATGAAQAHEAPRPVDSYSARTRRAMAVCCSPGRRRRCSSSVGGRHCEVQHVKISPAAVSRTVACLVSHVCRFALLTRD